MTPKFKTIGDPVDTTIELTPEAAAALDQRRVDLSFQLGFAVTTAQVILYLLKNWVPAPADSDAPVVPAHSTHLDVEVSRLMLDGKKIQAIELVRQSMPMSLLDAKNYVEHPRFPYREPKIHVDWTI